MPLSDEVRNLLLKYIAGETNGEETEKVARWLSEDEHIFMEFEQLWDLWYAVGTATNVFRFNVDKGWEAIVSKSIDTKAKDNGKRRTSRLVLWSSAAAAILLLVFFALWHQSDFRIGHGTETVSRSLSGNVRKETAPAAGRKDSVMTFATRGRERKQVRLPDGSRAWLNGNSRLTFKFENDSRMLVLRGEAFFDVSHDAKHPFVVRTQHATIKVLGTRFDVVAYPKDTVTDAILTSGSILFSAKTEHQSVAKHLVPGDKASINNLSNSLKISRVDTSFYISWKEGRLFFQGQKFQDIAKAMEHKYDVKIRFSDPGLARKRLNGYLEKESLTEALEALKLTLQFRYKIVDRTVIIYE